MTELDELMTLLDIPGISGHEDRVREYIAGELDKMDLLYESDRLGNLITHLGEGEPHLVFCAHMDELGLMITYIEDDGYMHFKKVGGIDDRVLLSRGFRIQASGGEVRAVIGIKPPHLMKESEIKDKEVPKIEDMRLDAGFESKEEAQKAGVEKMTTAVFEKNFYEVGKELIACRGLDDRAGCFALLNILRNLKDRELSSKVSFVWSVQEEVGLVGASAAAKKLDADLVVPVDTCSSADSPVTEMSKAPSKLGEGPVLRAFDSKAIASPKLVKFIRNLASRNGIPIQVSSTGGTTDGAAAQRHGAEICPIAFGARYTHSLVEMLNKNDLSRLIELCAVLARNAQDY